MRPIFHWNDLVNEKLAKEHDQRKQDCIVFLQLRFPRTQKEVRNYLGGLLQTVPMQVRLSSTAKNLKSELAHSPEGIKLHGITITRIEERQDAEQTLYSSESPPEAVYIQMAKRLTTPVCTFDEFFEKITPFLAEIQARAFEECTFPFSVFHRLWVIRHAFLLLQMWSLALDVPNPLMQAVSFIRAVGAEIIELTPDRKVVIIYDDPT